LSRKLITSIPDFLETVPEFEGRHLDYDEFFPWRFFWQLEELLTARYRIGVSRCIIGGRQISKSTSLAGEMTCKGHQPYHRMMYVAPQSELTKAFSTIRLDDMLETPVIHRNLFLRSSKFIPKITRDVKIKTKNDVFGKRFVTGSYIQLSFSDGTETRRLRSYSIDDAYVDEAQSMTALSSVHHVLKYCLRSSRNPRILNTGTTLGDDEFSNLAENDSLFFVYHVRCEACNREQDLRSLDNIDPVRRKIICRFCGKPLNVRENGRFIALNPEARLLGMHANMLMMPSLRKPYDEGLGTWEIITDVINDKNKTDGEKKEELLGVPSTGGEMPITRETLNECLRIKTIIENVRDVLSTVPDEVDGLILGIDWGGDSDPEQRSLPEEYMKSHTAFSINGLRYNPENTRVQMKILYEHTFPFENPNKSLATIKEICKIIMPKMIGVAADHGGGFFPNAELTDYLKKINPELHFLKVELLPLLACAIEVTSYNVVKVYKANLITEYFRKITRKEIFMAGQQGTALPDFYTGALAQRKYIDKRGKRFWKKRGKVSDDAFMSAVFAYVLAIVVYDRLHELLKNVSKRLGSR